VGLTKEIEQDPAFADEVPLAVPTSAHPTPSSAGELLTRLPCTGAAGRPCPCARPGSACTVQGRDGVSAPGRGQPPDPSRPPHCCLKAGGGERCSHAAVTSQQDAGILTRCARSGARPSHTRSAWATSAWAKTGVVSSSSCMAATSCRQTPHTSSFSCGTTRAGTDQYSPKIKRSAPSACICRAGIPMPVTICSSFLAGISLVPPCTLQYHPNWRQP